MKFPSIRTIRDILATVVLLLVCICLITIMVTGGFSSFHYKNGHSYNASQSTFVKAPWYALKYLRIKVYNPSNSVLANNIRVSLKPGYNPSQNNSLGRLDLNKKGIATFKITQFGDYFVIISCPGYKTQISNTFHFKRTLWAKTIRIPYNMEPEPISQPDYYNNNPVPAPVAPASFVPDQMSRGTDSNFQRYVVVFDSVRVRQTPGLTGKTVAIVFQNDVVRYMNVESTTKSMVTLRGTQYVDTWMKIRTEDGVEGWIFKPMLRQENEYEDDDC